MTNAVQWASGQPLIFHSPCILTVLWHVTCPHAYLRSYACEHSESYQSQKRKHFYVMRTLRANVPAEVSQLLLSGKCHTNVAETSECVIYPRLLSLASKTCDSNSNMEYSYSYLCRRFFITYKDFFVAERNQVLKHWKLCFGANFCAFILWCLCLFGLLRLRGTLHCCFMSS